jgi:hypothetical protein
LKKKATKMRGIRLSEATCKAVVQTAKVRSYDSPSAFMRAAIEKELRGVDSKFEDFLAPAAEGGASANIWMTQRAGSRLGTLR